MLNWYFVYLFIYLLITELLLFSNISTNYTSLDFPNNVRFFCQSFQKNAFFCDFWRQKSLIMRHVLLKNAMEYAIWYLCNFMRWGNLQKLRFDEKEKKKLFPQHLLFHDVHVA